MSEPVLTRTLNNDVANTSVMNGTTALSERVKELRLTGKIDNDKKSSSSTAWLPWILCIGMAITWASVGIKWYKTTDIPKDTNPATTAGATSKSDSPTNRPTESKPVAIDAITLETKGYLIPSHQIPISPIDVSGRVVELYIEEGKRFNKGEVLAVLDDVLFRAERDEAKASRDAAKKRWEELKNGNRKAEIEQARHELDEMKAQLKQYELDWKRSMDMRPGVTIASKEVEQAEALYRMQQQRVNKMTRGLELMIEGPRVERIETAKAEYEAAEARLLKAEWRLANCKIKAPVTGVILTKKAEYGSLINPVVGGVSTNLCDMADLSQLEVDLDIQERDISKIQLDMVCKIKADAYPTREYIGYLDRVMPIANRAKGIIPVRVRVVLPENEPQGKFLKPEMGVSVMFINRIDPTLRQKTEASDAAAAQSSSKPTTVKEGKAN